MKKTIIPTYRAEVTYISFNTKRRESVTLVWNCKRNGRPSEKNAKRYREKLNKSLEPGGSNEHLRSSQSDFGTVKIINQKTDQIAAQFRPALFEVIE